MKKEDVIKAWKNPELRNDSTPENPIGEAMNKDQEAMIKGGISVIDEDPSEGWICGISGEVTGKCCNPITSFPWPF